MHLQELAGRLTRPPASSCREYGRILTRFRGADSERRRFTVGNANGFAQLGVPIDSSEVQRDGVQTQSERQRFTTAFGRMSEVRY
jgi:hypothetical protein